MGIDSCQSCTFRSGLFHVKLRLKAFKENRSNAETKFPFMSKSKIVREGVGMHSSSIHASHPADLGSYLSVPKVFSSFDDAAFNQHCLEQKGACAK